MKGDEMPDYGPPEYVVIYSDLGSEDLNESEVFTSKKEAEDYIESRENKAYLIKGYALTTECHT
jgi:hypothetical protein